MIAAIEVEAIQRLNQRAKDDKTYHFLFSFREGEIPSPEVLLDCEREFCSALGFAEHQRVSVVHHDTNNLHVHVAVNKIHPTRLTIHTPLRDYWIRTETAKRLEAKHHLLQDRHERRNPEEGPIGRAADMERHSGTESFVGWVQRQAAAELCRAGSWAELHRAAAAHGVQVQLRGNGCVLTAGVRSARASSVRRELSLAALQKRLGPFEPAQAVAARTRASTMQASRRPADARGAAPPPAARGPSQLLTDLLERHSGASSSGPEQTTSRSIDNARSGPARSTSKFEITAPSKEQQQQRAGAWAKLIDELWRAERAKREASAEGRGSQGGARGARAYRARPLGDHAEAPQLYERFVRERGEREAMRRERIPELRRTQQADFERVLSRWRLRRAALRLVKGTRNEKRFMHAAARIAMQQELKAVRARAAEDRAGLARSTKRLVWADWLQERARAGDAVALDVLRRRKAASPSDSANDNARALAGPPRGAGGAAVHGAIDTVTKTGVVIYRGALTGVRDDGQSLRVQGRVSRAVLVQALRLAANRYGSELRVEGDDAFKQAVLDVAVAHNIEVTFDDAGLEARRKHVTENDHERRPQPRNQTGTTHAAPFADRPAAGRQDRLRDVRVGELVRDGHRSQRLLQDHVPADLARGAGEDRQAVRRAAAAARGVTRGAPPFRRGRLRSLEALTAPPRTMPASQRHRASTRLPPPQGSVPSAAVPPAVRNAMSARARAPAPRTATPVDAAIARYIAEREGKRARGVSDILPHTPFDGRPGEFAVVGRRHLAGHDLVLLRDNARILVVAASEQAAELRVGSRVHLDADGRISNASHTRGRS
jgi:hypothetical protein